MKDYRSLLSDLDAFLQAVTDHGVTADVTHFPYSEEDILELQDRLGEMFSEIDDKLGD